MYVCLCHSITDQDIRTAVARNGARTMRDLRLSLGLCAWCGRCGEEALATLKRARNALRAMEVRIELPSAPGAHQGGPPGCAHAAERVRLTEKPAGDACASQVNVVTAIDPQN